MVIVPDVDNIQYTTPYRFYIKEMVNNDFCQMCLWYYGETKTKIYYSIFLRVGKKKKNVNFKQTGRNGLACLTWGEKALLEFEKYIIENKEKFLVGNKEEIYIIIFGDDRKREKVYAHGLKKHKYYYTW